MTRRIFSDMSKVLHPLSIKAKQESFSKQIHYYSSFQSPFFQSTKQ